MGQGGECHTEVPCPSKLQSGPGGGTFEFLASQPYLLNSFTFIEPAAAVRTWLGSGQGVGGAASIISSKNILNNPK